MSDVTLSYKGSDILELSDSGSATLKTGGTYCEADIELEYVKPSGGGDSDVRLISEFNFTVPEQTSAAQTINIPFDTSTLDYYQGNVPFLLYLKSETEPETPTLRTLVERWELFSLHSNHSNYIYSRGFWARIIGTDGTSEYTTGTYGDLNAAGQLLNMSRINSNPGIGIQLKASATTGTVQTGTWHGKLYRISGFKG